MINNENQPPTSDSATAVNTAGGVQPTASSANPSCTAGTAASASDTSNPPIATSAGSDITLTLVSSSGSAAPLQSTGADASMNSNPGIHPVGGPLVHNEHLYHGRPNDNNYEHAESDDSNSQRIQRPPGEPQNSDSVTSVQGAISNRGWEIPSSHAEHLIGITCDR